MMLASFMLWLISKKPRHGYEIIGLLNKEVCYGTVGAGYVYPLLSDLAKNGLIKSKSIAHGKRMKKHYTITREGKKRLSEMRKAFFSCGLRAQFIREMVR
jgi:DNA-binding PadR family transcriptional regulator